MENNSHYSRLFVWFVMVSSWLSLPAICGEAYSVTPSRLTFGNVSFSVSASMATDKSSLVTVKVKIKDDKPKGKAMHLIFAPRVYITKGTMTLAIVEPSVTITQNKNESTFSSNESTFSFQIDKSLYVDSIVQVIVLTKDHIDLENMRVEQKKRRAEVSRKLDNLMIGKGINEMSEDDIALLTKEYSNLREHQVAMRRLWGERLSNELFDLRLKDWKVTDVRYKD